MSDTTPTTTTTTTTTTTPSPTPTSVLTPILQLVTGFTPDLLTSNTNINKAWKKAAGKYHQLDFSETWQGPYRSTYYASAADAVKAARSTTQPELQQLSP